MKVTKLETDKSLHQLLSRFLLEIHHPEPPSRLISPVHWSLGSSVLKDSRWGLVPAVVHGVILETLPSQTVHSQSISIPVKLSPTPLGLRLGGGITSFPGDASTRCISWDFCCCCFQNLNRNLLGGNLIHTPRSLKTWNYNSYFEGIMWKVHSKNFSSTDKYLLEANIRY